MKNTNASLLEAAPAMLDALEKALHELTTLQGLEATDRSDIYDKSFSNGCDASGAWSNFQETLFTIKSETALVAIKDALAKARGEL